MSKQQTRRLFTADQKVAILKRHLIDKVQVSDLCDEYQLTPSLFYEWQRKLMENAVAALEAGRSERGEQDAGAGEEGYGDGEEITSQVLSPKKL